MGGSAKTADPVGRDLNRRILALSSDREDNVSEGIHERRT